MTDYELDNVTIATPEGLNMHLRLAGVGSRAMAVMIDQIIQTLVSLALILGAIIAGSTYGFAILAVLLFVVQIGYYIAFEALDSGRTPGKRLAGIRVVAADGRAATFTAIVIRNLIRVVDFLPGAYLVGIVTTLASDRSQRLGDMAAGTVVVHQRTGAGGTSASTSASAPGAAYQISSCWPVDGDGWDVSAVTANDASVVRSFLGRRATLNEQARHRLAEQIAGGLRTKVIGGESLGHEAFLESLLTVVDNRR